jgi:hypothetical protein
MFAQMIRDAYPKLGSDSITLVVRNRDMVAGVRWQDQAGKRAIDGIVRFALNPEEEATKHPDVASAVAEAFYEHASLFKMHTAQLWTPRKMIATLDENFVEELKRVAHEKKPAAAIKGNTIIYSQVHKVGRASGKSRHDTARIDIDGKPQDVPIKSGREALFFDAAKNRVGTYAIHVMASWSRTEDGAIVLDARRSRATRISEWKAISGADVLQSIDPTSGPMFEDLEDIVDFDNLIGFEKN